MGYREMFRSYAKWSPENKQTLDAVRHHPQVSCTMSYKHRHLSCKQVAVHQPTHHIHVLDLLPRGEVFPHVDHVKYAGPVIIGLCLLTPAIMQLTEVSGPGVVNALLQPRSLYIMSGAARWDYKHAVLGGSHSWHGIPFTRGRRIALIFRHEPE